MLHARSSLSDRLREGIHQRNTGARGTPGPPTNRTYLPDRGRPVRPVRWTAGQGRTNRVLTMWRRCSSDTQDAQPTNRPHSPWSPSSNPTSSALRTREGLKFAKPADAYAETAEAECEAGAELRLKSTELAELFNVGRSTVYEPSNEANDPNNHSEPYPASRDRRKCWACCR